MSLLDDASDLLEAMQPAWDAHMRRYPGERSDRQPIHTLYFGAHRFDEHSVAQIGEQARAAFARYADDAFALAHLLEFPGHDGLPARTDDDARVQQFTADPDRLRRADFSAWLALTVHARVRQRLATAPVEDLRLDFEDGYGFRPDAEEDAHAERTARAVATTIASGAMPPFFGIRVKPLGLDTAARSIQTIDRFVSTLVVELGGKLPPGFVITLPKVLFAEQLRTADLLLERLEKRLSLPRRSIRLEFMVEVTQALFDESGRLQLPSFIAAAGERLLGVHLGVYDYTASAGVTAIYQEPTHPACELVRGFMKLAYSGTGVFLSDGSTNVLPVEPHPNPVTDTEREANRRAIERAWCLAHEHIRHALIGGYVQGWDLHPAQLPIRYAATYRFYLEGFDAAAHRLEAFLKSLSAATDTSEVQDDAATGQALLNFFLRARASGAVTDDELLRTGVRPDEWASRSFAQILASRRRDAKG